MNIINYFVDLIYLRRCLICKNKNETVLCKDCINSINKIEPPFCFRCGVPLKDYNVTYPICRYCREGKRYSFRLARQVGIYEDKLKEMINLFKYKRKRKLAYPLGKLLVDYLRSDDKEKVVTKDYKLKNIEKFYFPKFYQFDYLIPVPLTKLKFFIRGFNQAELLCKVIEEEVGIPLLSDCLIKVRNTKSQMSIKMGKETYKLRRDNVKNAFRVKEPEKIKNKNILLIDDVLTTGATCNECAQVLRKAHCKNVYVLTLARGI